MPDKDLRAYARQWITQADKDAVGEVLDGDFLTSGPRVADFEKALAAASGAPLAVSAANGTAALHLLMLALGVGPGIRVVVPSITFLATANAVLLAGGEVVFADVDPDSGLMTPETLDEACGRSGAKGVTGAVTVHLGGQVHDLEGMAGVARRHGIWLAEDACHAIGGRYRGSDGKDRPVGDCTHSVAAAFSFHPVKTLTTGEGGALSLRDETLAERVRLLREHGMVRNAEAWRDPLHRSEAEDGRHPWYYEMQALGLNYRITDLQCALGLSQLARLQEMAATRRDRVARYRKLLAEMSLPIRPIRWFGDSDPCWHLFTVLIDFDALGQSRVDVMRRLRDDHGIGTQVHYIPVHTQPFYRDRYGELELPGTDAYYARTLSLPLHPQMSPEDVDRVADALASTLSRGGKA